MLTITSCAAFVYLKAETICWWQFHIHFLARKSLCFDIQFQSAFKVKTTTAVAAITIASGADADTANRFESAWSELKGFFAGCCHRSLLSFQEPPVKKQKPGGGIRRWTKLYEKSVHGSKFTVPWRREAWRQRPRLKETKTAFIGAKCGAKHTVLLASLRQGKRNSPQYPHVVMVFSASPNRWTTQTRTLLVRIMYAMMLVSLNSLTKTRWRHGLSTMLGCSMLNLNEQATSFLRSLQLRQFGVGVGVHQGSCP